jgi:hypothetical protein
MKKLFTICAVMIVLFGTGYVKAGTWTTIDCPDIGTTNTTLYGIDGGNIVGCSSNSATSYGFLYNGTSWTLIQNGVSKTNPWGNETYPWGIDGSNIVGYYDNGDMHGFRYNGSMWITLNFVASDKRAYDISGSNIVGSCNINLSKHGFLYNGSSLVVLDAPEATSTTAHGIDGSNIVGYYLNVSGGHGFLYNGTSWTTIDMPGETFTCPFGIDGSNIVGYYTDVSGYHGFLYDGTSWTTLDAPGAAKTYPCSIDGSNIVGYYEDTSGYTHGFLYTIPEPATICLFTIAGFMLRRKK